MAKPNIPEERTIPIASSGNQGGIRMWPSEDWASKLSDWANIGLIASLIAGVISTALLVWMGNVKEAYLKVHLGAASERAAHAEERAGRLEKDASELRKTAEDERLARVELEAKVAWRKLTKNQISEMGTSLAAFPRQLTALVYNVADLEAYSFATDIDVALHEFAKWNIAEPQAVLKMREGPVNFGTNPPLERGVVVSSTSDEHSRAAAKAVVDKLSSFGFDAVIGGPIPKETPTVQIFVEPTESRLI